MSESKRCWFPTSPNVCALIVERLCIMDLVAAGLACKCLQTASDSVLRRTKGLAFANWTHDDDDDEKYTIIRPYGWSEEHGNVKRVTIREAWRSIRVSPLIVCFDLFSRLDQLDLSEYCMDVSGEAMAKLAPRLRSFVLCGWTEDSPGLVQQMANCTQLERLVCVSDDAYMIANMTKLVELQVVTRRPDAWCKQLAESKPRLERLRIHHPKLGNGNNKTDIDNLLVAIRAHPRVLRKLSINCICRVQDANRLVIALQHQLDAAEISPHPSDECPAIWRVLKPDVETHVVVPPAPERKATAHLTTVANMTHPELCTLYFPKQLMKKFYRHHPFLASEIHYQPNEQADSWRFWTQDL